MKSLDNEKPVIGISACLMGQSVRYDGGHKRDRFITDELAEHVDLRPVCPEMAIGLGVPREPIRLVRKEDGIHAVGVNDDRLDVTEALQRVAIDTVASLPPLSGYIVMRNSPSCGMERVKVYDHDGVGHRRVGRGLYTRELMERHPELPVEEGGRLQDLGLRDNFVRRVYVYARWQALMEKGMSRNDLIEFHAAHKYMLLAHGQVMYKALGRMLSDLKGPHFEQIRPRYIRDMMQGLRVLVSRGDHANVMQHLMGYLRPYLDGDDKRELLENIHRYRQGVLPLVVPLTLLRHHFRRHPHPYVEGQYYLNPYPEALMPRSSL